MLGPGCWDRALSLKAELSVLVGHRVLGFSGPACAGLGRAVGCQPLQQASGRMSGQVWMSGMFGQSLFSITKCWRWMSSLLLRQPVWVSLCCLSQDITQELELSPRARPRAGSGLCCTSIRAGGLSLVCHAGWDGLPVAQPGCFWEACRHSPAAW